jgi:ATP-binding cassette subfamily B protein
VATPGKPTGQTAGRGPRDEQRLGATRDLRLLASLWRFVRPYRGLFLLSLLLLPAVSACLLVQPWIVRNVIDNYISAGNTDGMGSWILLFGAAVLGEFTFMYWQHYTSMLVAQKALADLRVELFRRVLALDSSWYDHNPVGRTVTRLTTDVDVINDMFAAGAITILMDVLTLLGIIAIMFSLNAPLALVTLSTLPVLVILIDFFRRKARRNYRWIRERIARINAYLQEAISGIAVVQVFAREKAASAEFDRLNSLHRDAAHRANIYEASLFSIVEALSSISLALILWYGAHLLLGTPALPFSGLGGSMTGASAASSAISFGTLVAFIEYMNKFFIPVRDFSTKYAVMQSALTATERVQEMLELEPAIFSRPGAVTNGTIDTAGDIGNAVEFDQVDFAYVEGEPVLRNLSFSVRRGEHVAIVGATGSGKTTITRLLGRFYETRVGRVLVDGVDVQRWDTRALRTRVGSVQQDVYLFSDTIYNNIAMGNPQVSRERAQEAARMVNAHQFIERLADGYDTMVSERGSNFSTGQRQLLSFARALAWDPSILVLDEATSSVDPATEQLIQQALAALQKGRTSIVIAHRLSTVEQADRILVLHHGELREQGTHAELMARGGLYARLYELQYQQTG